MILAGMQIPRLAAPFALACHTGGQRYTGFQFTVIERQSHGNFALGMRDRAGYVRQLAQEWADRDARETRRRGIDAQHGAEEFVIRAGSPGVAIRARGIGCFGPSGQSAVEHGAPASHRLILMLSSMPRKTLNSSLGAVCLICVVPTYSPLRKMLAAPLSITCSLVLVM